MNTTDTGQTVASGCREMLNTCLLVGWLVGCVVVVGWLFFFFLLLLDDDDSI